MTLALAILFLWLGAALLYVAFHPAAEHALTDPGSVMQELADKMGSTAYKS